MIIGLDVDDVLLDLTTRWLHEYNEEWDDNLQKHNILTWDFWKYVRPECGQKVYDYLKPEMYTHINPLLGASQFVQELRDREHEIRFVSACGDPANAKQHMAFAVAKHSSLLRHDIASGDDLFLPGRDKSQAPVDVLVDDRVHNVDGFLNGPGILYDQPWNRWRDHYNRADSYTEALSLIDFYQETKDA